MNYHAMSIFPEYFKVDGPWIMAKESRMDCVPVYEDGVIYVKEFRLLKAGELVFTGRTENCEDGIYVYPDGFRESAAQREKVPAFEPFIEDGVHHVLGCQMQFHIALPGFTELPEPGLQV